MNELANKPEIVLFHFTDAFDKMCHDFTVARQLRRWPMRMFYGMLDQGCINASLLYNMNLNNEFMNHDGFMEKLSLELTIPHMQRRLNSSGLHTLL